MDYLDEDLPDDVIEVPVSALEHYSYCPRQCALIHVEQTFEENLFTIRGSLLHERVDSAQVTLVDGIRVFRGMPLWSNRLGLRGKADAVEFRPEGPYPVEYKSGRRLGPHADYQLCAQALCLEEMLGGSVRAGAVYHHASRSRYEVVFDAGLRNQTVAMINAIRDLLKHQRLPPPVNDARCPNCSLIDACLPGGISDRAHLRGLQGALFHPYGLEGGDDAGGGKSA